jgi:thymidylate synthase ThyX
LIQYPMDRKEYPSIELPKYSSKVTLLLRSTAPINTDNSSPIEQATLNSASVIAGEAARTCYSSDVQTPLDYLQKSDKYRKVTDDVIKSTKEAGHLTTRQHVSYTFALENVSRLAVNYLHSFPYYNSEEMSQRYVNLADTKPLTPDTGNQEINNQMSEIAQSLSESYNHLQELLIPTAKSFLRERFPGRKGELYEKQIDKDAGKKSQEIARYLLPLGMPTNLQYTVSELTLMRLQRLSQNLPVTGELSSIINGMVETSSSVDPSLKEELGESLPNFNRPKIIPKKVDDYLSESPATLDNFSPISPNIARGVRFVLGVSPEELPDQDALKLVLDPNENKLLAQVYGDIVIDHLSQALNQSNISTVISLSHTANYQLQRHRALNHTTPLLLTIPQSENDYVIPTILNSNPEALAYYLETLASHSKKLNELQEKGVSLENLQYLLPNAVRIRKSVSGPFGAWYHFLKTRNCFNAQEEINVIASSLTNQIINIDPLLTPYLEHLVPCGLRKQSGQTPFCPEGSRYCGVRIWDLTVNDFPKRNI